MLSLACSKFLVLGTGLALTLTAIKAAPPVITQGAGPLVFTVDRNSSPVSWKTMDKTYGGSVIEQAASALVTSDGGYLLTGFSASPYGGDKSQNTQGGDDYWIVKVGPYGNKNWDKTFGGNQADRATSAIRTNDGGYLIAGSSASPYSGDKSEASHGGNDFWIVKLDSSGNKQWDKTFGGNQEETATSVVASPDGGYLVAGHSTSGISGSKSQALIGGTDFWVIKINASGAKQWDKTYGERWTTRPTRWWRRRTGVT